MMSNDNDSPRADDLPSGWVWTTIGEITQPIEKVDPTQKPDAEFTYLDISSIDNTTQVIREPKVYYGAEAPSRARQLVHGGDVLFSTVRTYLKNIAEVPEAYNGQIASTGFSVLRGKEGISSKYLFYYSLTTDFLSALAELQRGTSYPAVRDSDVRGRPIPLAPLPEQHRVVAKIEELFTRLDAGVAALKRAQANLKRYKAAVLKAACEGRLVAQNPSDEPASVLLERILARRGDPRGRQKAWASLAPTPPDVDQLPELPSGWCYTFLQPLLSIRRVGMRTGPFGSLLKKHEHQETGIPMLGIENIESMKFVAGSKIHVTKEKALQLSNYLVEPGDVLISRSGTVGEVCVVSEGIGEALISTNLMRIILAPNGMLPSFFVLLFNGSPFVLKQISDLCSGSTRDFLNQEILSSIVFPLPPLAEQRRIVAEVERRLSVVQELEATLTANLARAERLRQSILKRAFEGKLVERE